MAHGHRISTRIVGAIAAGLLAAGIVVAGSGAARSSRGLSFVPVAAASDASLARGIESVLADPLLEGVTVAVHVEELGSGRVLFSRRADHPLTPGSNMKLLTTAAALDSLGSDFRFRTSVRTDGRLRDGTLDGDLVLVGGGDPTISNVFHERATDVLESLASQIYDAGVRNVTGDLVVDASFFDAEIHHPTWPSNQLHLRYCAPVSAIALNDNCVDFEISPGSQPGRRAIVSSQPYTRGFPVVNEVRTRAASRPPISTIDVQWRTNPSRFVVRGEISHNAGTTRVQAPIREPVEFAASVFRDTLERRGVRVAGTVRCLDASNAEAPRPLDLQRVGGAVRSYPLAIRYPEERFRRLATETSPLVDAIRMTNEESRNFCAEQILKTLGRVRGGEGSFDAGAGVVGDYLESIGITTDGFVIEDGSGLSRANRVSARAFVRLLQHMLTSEDEATRRVFFTSLPVSGMRGSLEKRLRGKAHRGRVAAKTGYVSRASALSGYAQAESGRTLVFSILMNGFRPPKSNSQMKKLQDRIAAALVDRG